MPSAFVVLAETPGPALAVLRHGCGREGGKKGALCGCHPAPRITAVPRRAERGHRQGAEARPRSRMLRARSAPSVRGPLLVPLPGAAVGGTVWLAAPRVSLPSRRRPLWQSPWPVLGRGHPPHPYIQAVPSRRQYFIAGGWGGKENQLRRGDNVLGVTSCHRHRSSRSESATGPQSGL